MKNVKKYILSAILFVVLILGTYYFILKDYSLDQFFKSLLDCSSWFILAAFLLLASYAFFHSLYLKRMLKHLGYKITWYQAFGYVFTEVYFSAITPSSMGGQPVQMMEMNYDGIPYRINSVVILLNTLIYKLALVTLAILGLIFYYEKLFSFNALFNWLVLLGFGTTILVMIGFFVLIYSKKTMEKVIQFVLFLLKKFKYKKVDEKEKKLKESLKEYQECAEFTKKHPLILLESYLILLCQRISILAISYVIYLSFGLREMSIFEVIAFQVCITLGSDFMPFPGGVVVSEGLLLQANQIIYGASLATSGMMLLRGISFYLLVIFSFIFYMCFHFLKRKKAQKLKQGFSNV